MNRYRIILETDDDGYIGTSVEMPAVFGDGKTVEECVKSTHESLLGSVVTLLELGQRPPLRGKRDAQVNVRLSADEKLLLTEAARGSGQRVSEFIRTAALERIRAWR